MRSIMFTVLAALLLAACTKNDSPVTAAEQDNATEKFFNSYTSSRPAVMALQQYAQRENNRLPFIKQMMKKAGIPRWDKALVFEDVKVTTGRGADLGENSTVIHVPMVPENGNMVQGSLMVRMSPGDTVMNLVAAQDYASYGFGAAPANGWNANDVFSVLTKLDNMVFGRTKYRVTDGRIFGDSQQVRRVVTIDHTPVEPSLTDLFVTLNVCNLVTVCISAGEPGSGICNTYQYCTTYYIEFPGGNTGGGGSGGGGSGGGPTGGGGTGGNGGPIGWVPFEDDPEFDEDAESALLTQVFTNTSAPHTENVTFTSPTMSNKPFQWVVVKNFSNLWQVISSDIAIGYNSTGTGPIIYNIEHSGSQITGVTSWNRIPRVPGDPAYQFINLSWTETSNEKFIASTYRWGSITVSGTLKNYGISVSSHTQTCTINAN